jgi:hypothetical protein
MFDMAAPDGDFDRFRSCRLNCGAAG